MNIKLFQDNCLEIIRKIPSNSIDLILTDSPYGIDYKNNRRKKNGRIKTENGILNDERLNIYFLKEVIKECYRILKDGRHFYWFGRFDALVKQAIEIENVGFKIKNELIWLKNNHGTGDLKYSYGTKHESIIYAIKKETKTSKIFPLQKLEDGITRHNNILEFAKVNKKEMIHDHQKPIELLSFLIKKSSMENEIVLDPFMGSGSTIIAAKKLNRKAIGIELNKEIFEEAKERIEKN